MHSLQQLRRQIDSFTELRAIVRTMKALSAASIHQFETAAAALVHYSRTIELGLHVVLEAESPVAAPMPAADTGGPSGIIVFGSDHGLCGRFNVDIAEYAGRHIEEPAAARNDYRLLAVGAQAAARLGQDGYAVDLCLPLPALTEQITGTVQRILMHVDAWREHDRCRTVRVFHNRRDGRSLHTPAERKLLPLDRQDVQRYRQDPWPSRRLPIFTMDRTVLLSRLVRQYLFITLFRACAESQASEHASRVAAMQSAEGSIAEKLDDTMMQFRRARQRAITAELMDVITGYEASHSQERGGFGPEGSGSAPRLDSI